jgi:MtN3 and saliva related transmembrane protein
MKLITFLGWTQTILFSIVLIPQIIKTWKIKKVDEISILVFILSLIANIIALWYAILITQPPLIFKYITGGILCFIYIVVFYYYRKNK